MRTALVFAYDFPPIASAAAQRNRGLVAHLPEHGWRPVVVTARRGTSWAHDPATAERLPREVEVVRTGSIEPARVARSLLGRRGPAALREGLPSPFVDRLREWLLVPDPRLGWIPFAVLAGLRWAPEADVVVSANPPASAHLAAALVAGITRRPWVADFHDPWSLPSYEPWRGRWRPAVDRRLERAVLRRADRVVATTRWLAGYLAGRGAGDRVRVVPNGYDPAEHAVAARPDDAFTVLHAGAFYGPRSPEPLLEAVAEALETEPAMRTSLRLRLRDWQDARNAALLEAATRRLGLEDVVERVPPVPRRDALAAMHRAAVLVLVTDPVEGGRGLIPIKLFEYLGAGRPILALAPPDGEAGRLVRQAGGVVADPSDVAGAAGALIRLYRSWRSGEDGHRPNPEVVEAHRWDRLAGLLARVLDEVSATGGG